MRQLGLISAILLLAPNMARGFCHECEQDEGYHPRCVHFLPGAGMLSMEIPAARFQPPEPGAQVDQALGDQVHDFTFDLQLPENAHQAGAE